MERKLKMILLIPRISECSDIRAAGRQDRKVNKSPPPGKKKLYFIKIGVETNIVGFVLKTTVLKRIGDSLK